MTSRPQRRSTDPDELRRSRVTPMLMSAFAAAMLTAALVVSALALGNVGDDTSAIQKSREESVRRACVEQNQRHDRTIATLDVLLHRYLKNAGPRERRRLQASRQSTVLLIDALAPKRDCDALVKRVVYLT